jgi:hypothetical protein
MKIVSSSVISLLAAITFTACGGSSDNSASSAPSCEDVSGTYNITDAFDTTQCGHVAWSMDEYLIVTQSGCSVTVEHQQTDFFGDADTGTLEGNTVTLHTVGPFAEGHVQFTFDNGTLRGASVCTITSSANPCGLAVGCQVPVTYSGQRQ